MRIGALPRRLRIAVITFTSTSAGLWSLAVAELWLRLSGQADRLTEGAAITLTVIAALVITAACVRDRDKDLLLRCLVDASQRAAEARTVPLRVVRQASRP